MTTSTPPRLLAPLPAAGRDRLMELSGEAHFSRDARIFEEGRRADRFWIIRSGTVTLDLRVPGRHPAQVDTLGADDLLGWSWLFPPYTWHLGATAQTPVRAWEFEAKAVRALCEEEPAFGQALTRCVAEIIARRLQKARRRLLDLYGPQGSGFGL